MSYWGLKKKGVEPLYPSEWNTVLDALDELYTGVSQSAKISDLEQVVKYHDLGSLGYDIVPDKDMTRDLGSIERVWARIYAGEGYFRGMVYSEGKPVLRDGDPITISEIDTIAQSQITKSIDASLLTLYTGEIRDKVQAISVDESGRVGIAILHPLDDYGRVRVSAEHTTTELTKVSGVTLTGRDWSQDFANLQNLDTALSTRASESTLQAVRDRLPSSLTTAGNLKVALLEDSVGVAKDTTLSSFSGKFPSASLLGDSMTNPATTVVGSALLGFDGSNWRRLRADSSGYLRVNIGTDEAGLAKDSTVAAVRDRLPSSLTSAGNLKVALLEESVDIAKDTTLQAVRDRLPSSLTTAGNLKVALLEESVGLAKDGTVAAVRDRLPSSLTAEGNFKVALQEDSVGLAKESTLSGIKSQTDKLTFDTNSYLYVNAASVANPSNLDVALSTRASESTLQAVRDRLPSSLTAAGNLKVALLEDSVGLAKESTLSGIKSKVDQLTFDEYGNLLVSVAGGTGGTTTSEVTIVGDNVGLARESTLSGIKSQTDKLTFDGSSYLYVRLGADGVGVAKDSTLSGFSGKFPSASALSDSMGNPSTTVVGGALLGFDGNYWRRLRADSSGYLRVNISADGAGLAKESTLSGIKSKTDKLSFDGSNRLYVNAASVANPSNLDVALSTRASESTLQDVRDRLPSSLTSAGNLKVALLEDGVGVAKESTLSGIKSQTDKLKFDGNSHLYVNAASVSNPPALDVNLSTRASESTLSSFSGKFPSASALSDSMSNPTTTVVGSALLGFDGNYWRRLRADTDGVLRVRVVGCVH